MTVLSDLRVDPAAAASAATLESLDALLEGLVPSAQPAVVLTGLARLCVTEFSDRCTVELVEDGGAAYVVDPTGVSAGAAVDLRPRGGGLLRTAFEGAAHGATAYRGTAVFTWPGRTETTLDAVVARVLIARAVSLIAEERLAEQVRHADSTTANLRIALATSRVIGNAVGILMVAHKVTETAAFELLRDLSQRCNRKVADIAADVVATGCLDHR